MHVVFKTKYTWLSSKPNYGDVNLQPFVFEPAQEFLDDDPEIRDWLVEHGIDWQTCIGVSTRPWVNAPEVEWWRRNECATALDTWIEFEDPSLAVLFKLKWC